MHHINGMKKFLLVENQRLMFRVKLLLVVIFSFVGASKAQILTHEDSLSAGLEIRGTSATAISGYGEIAYKNNLYNNTALAQLQRAVLFVGHRFRKNISFFSEMELENGTVKSGATGGEFSLEQCFIKFDLNRMVYINAGFFTPRIGQINENHLPNTFNGVYRPIVEQVVIPATWREIGISLYGRTRSIPGLNYSFGIMNGLNAQNFSLSEGIRGGRSEGYLASARNLAITGAVLYYYGGLRLQASTYIGGSVGLDDTTAGRLDIQTGTFGTPVFLNEANLQYRNGGLIAKGLVCVVQIPDASNINATFANNTPERIFGAYVELGYDFLYKKYAQDKQLIGFCRYERVDMNNLIPENGLANLAYTQNHIIAGFSYLPVRGVAIKLDYHKTLTGDFNKAFVVNPAPYLPIWYKNMDVIHLGLAYSF